MNIGVASCTSAIEIFNSQEMIFNIVRSTVVACPLLLLICMNVRLRSTVVC